MDFGFTGEQTDGSGQVFLRARYYDPGIGVFTALDPVEGMMDRPMSLNGYSWVEGNTPNMVDPSGKDAVQSMCGVPLTIFSFLASQVPQNKDCPEISFTEAVNVLAYSASKETFDSPLQHDHTKAALMLVQINTFRTPFTTVHI